MPIPDDRIERKRVLLSPRSVWVNERTRTRSPDSGELRLERSSKQRQLPMTPSGSLLSPGGGERKRASTPSVHPPAPDPTACLRRASELPGGGEEEEVDEAVTVQTGGARGPPNRRGLKRGRLRGARKGKERSGAEAGDDVFGFCSYYLFLGGFCIDCLRKRGRGRVGAGNGKKPVINRGGSRSSTSSDAGWSTNLIAQERVGGRDGRTAVMRLTREKVVCSAGCIFSIIYWCCIYFV